MTALGIFIDLCNTTDGRDKIYKAAGGLAKSLGDMPSVPHAKNFKKLGKGITDARSLIRMAKWTGNIQKINAYVPKANTIGLKEIVEILRIIGDFGYVFGDNVQYLAKYGLIPVDAKYAKLQAKTFQFYGYVFASLLDAYALFLVRAEAFLSKKQKDTLLSLIKNLSDVLATLAVVGYAKPLGYNPSDFFSGCMAIISGSIATYSNVKKIAAKKAK